MNSMRRIHAAGRTALHAAVAIALLCVMPGCRSSRTAATHGTDYTGMSLTERARLVAEANMPWVQLNLPVKVALKSPKKVSLSGRIYMRRDRDIYITLRVLGMEVANMYVNSDSIYAADKLHKLYVAEPIKDIFAGASLSIGDIQDALLGRVFINGTGTLDGKSLGKVNLSPSPDNSSWTLTPKSKIGGDIAYSFNFDYAGNNLISLVFNAAGKLYGCTYSEAADTDAGRFMERLGIAATIGKTTVDATITYDFDKMKTEVPASARWRSNSNYRRINPAALAKAFEDM